MNHKSPSHVDGWMGIVHKIPKNVCTKLLSLPKKNSIFKNLHPLQSSTPMQSDHIINKSSKNFTHGFVLGPLQFQLSSFYGVIKYFCYTVVSKFLPGRFTSEYAIKNWSRGRPRNEARVELCTVG